MPACPDEVAKDVDVKGAILPKGIVLTDVQREHQVTEVKGFVQGRTPRQIRDELERRQGIEVLHSEDEVVEAELLLSDGTFNTFIKAESKCEGGSTIEAAVGRNVDQPK